ncbi:hypothetical protein DVH24_007951 [Malus domestica]|uniref:Uncharacterized protein n=1 Tax=Malus domestica TaxID=3750 RepID=A0A498JQB5_MALDO|nr:hypothetical protein DVH24_007951 [Malus domestica]
MEKRRKIQSETSFLLLELFCPSITTLPDNGVDSDESDDDHMIEEWMVSEASPRRFSLWKGRISGRISPSFYPTASLHSRTMLSTGMTSDFLRFGSFMYMDTSEDFESVFSGNVAQGDLCWPILGLLHQNKLKS